MIGELTVAITTIDFHVDDHLVQVTGDLVLIFKDCDTSQQPIELDTSDLSRILTVADEQIERKEDDVYALAG